MDDVALQSAGDRRRQALLGAVVVALLAAVPGQGADDRIFYSRQYSFRIPFTIDPGDRRVQQVILHVSEDLGRTYQKLAVAGPADNGFDFQARKDGWYYFGIQTRDNEGRYFPPAVDRLEPGLRVLVDSQPPRVSLRTIPTSNPNLIGVEWDIQDLALDLNSLRLEYRVANGEWQPRGVQFVAAGQLSWNPGAPGPVEVRLQVRDRAENSAEKTVVARGDPGMGKAEDPPGGTGGDAGAGAVRKVNSTKVRLNYSIEGVGPSDVSTIEVWITKDGKAWTRYAQNASRKPPFEVEVDGEGRHGITLVAKSGVGLGERAPKPGDVPQLWVEVDLTKPVVQITDAVVGQGDESGKLTVRWTATDANLGANPISLSYSTKAEGPWTAVPGATNMANTGSYAWRLGDGLPYQFYLRVEAVDEAGNIGSADTKETVKVDLSTPRARVIGVEPAKPQP